MKFFVVVLIMIVFAAASVAAQSSFNYADFNSTTGLNLTGNAVQSGTALRLTSNAQGQQGAAFYNTAVDVTAFSTIFRFRITDLVGGGADGFSFNVRPGGPSLEPGAGGETGTNQGLAVQFDTFQNDGEPNANFIRLRLNGTVVAQNLVLPVNLKDGQIHTVLLNVLGNRATLLLDGIVIFDVAGVNLSGQSPAYVGFGARTGGSAETHDILSWSFAGGAAMRTVTKTADTNDGVCDSDCSLREAIATVPFGGAIRFASPLFDTAQTITLSNGELPIPNSMTILGRSPTLTTVSGNNVSRVFNSPNSTARVIIHGLLITAGQLTGPSLHGGGIQNTGTLDLMNCALTGNKNTFGGGIANFGTLNLANTTLSENQGVSQGGGVYNSGVLNVTQSTFNDNVSATGAGISNAGTANLRNVTVRNCTASSGGGGIHSNGPLTAIGLTLQSNIANNFGGGLYVAGGNVSLVNSTISGNVTFFQGGGIYGLCGGCTLNLTNTTVTGNSANIFPGSGGGIHHSITVNARNSIISGNSSPTNPNLSGLLNINDSNIVNNEASVRIGPLSNNGLSTLTHSLLSGSTAINAGNDCVVTASCAGFNAPIALNLDQRGAARVGQVDIGSFEVNNTGNGGAYRVILPEGRVGTAYCFQVTPNNGATTLTLGAGAPPGLSLQSAFAKPVSKSLTAPSAIINLAGTPTFGGVFNFPVIVTDGSGNDSVVDFQLSVVTPTAAGVSVSGRVMTSNGRGLANATVTLTDASGETRNVRTGSFGYFRFDDVAAGQTVVVQVKSRRFVFAPQVVYLGDKIADLEFIGGE